MDDATASEDFGLTCNFKVDGALHVRNGVHVLHFHLGAKYFAAFGHDRNVGIATQTSFFHVSIADVEVSNQTTNFGNEGIGFFSRFDIGLGNDFNQGCSGTVIIYQSIIKILVVHAFARVFLHMNAGKSDFFDRTIAQFDLYGTFIAQWGIELCYLISLRQISVEIVFTGISVDLPNITIQCQSHFNGIVDGGTVMHWQCSWMTETNGAHLSVWQGAIFDTIRREGFTLGL